MIGGLIDFLCLVGIPGMWIWQILFLIFVAIVGKALFKEKNIKGKIFWNSYVVLFVLIIIRIAW